MPSSSSCRIRRFEPGDNPDVLALAASLGVSSRAKLGVDRSPDFLAWDRVQSRQYDVWIAEAGGRVVGFIDQVYVHYRLGSHQVLGSYIGLAGVHRDWRGRGVFSSLYEAAREAGRNKGSQIVVILVNVNNPRVSGVAVSVQKSPIVELEPLYVHGLFLNDRVRVPAGAHFDAATPTDWKAIRDCLAEGRRAYDLERTIDENDLRSLPGFLAADMWIARDGSGRVVATLGVWDSQAFKRIRLLRYRKLEWLVAGMLNLIGPWGGFAPLPKAGEELRMVYGVWMAARPGQIEALSGLVRHACRHYARRGYSLLMLAFPKNDPLRQACQGLWKVTNINLPKVAALTEEAERYLIAAPPRTVCLEYPLT